MNKLSFVMTGVVFLASCATPKVSESTKNESADLTKTYQQAEIKQAVEMRRFLIKFNRLYVRYGGTFDLVPKANYILLDGDKVVINAAYVGRQYSYRPISGIDMKGKAISFELKNNTSKGYYEIRMKVKNNINTFDVIVTISNDGYCDTSLDSYRIDHVRYTGSFIPLEPKEEKNPPANPEKGSPADVIM